MHEWLKLNWRLGCFLQHYYITREGERTQRGFSFITYGILISQDRKVGFSTASCYAAHLQDIKIHLAVYPLGLSGEPFPSSKGPRNREIHYPTSQCCRKMVTTGSTQIVHCPVQLLKNNLLNNMARKMLKRVSCSNFSGGVKEYYVLKMVHKAYKKTWF